MADVTHGILEDEGQPGYDADDDEDYKDFKDFKLHSPRMADEGSETDYLSDEEGEHDINEQNMPLKPHNVPPLNDEDHMNEELDGSNMDDSSSVPIKKIRTVKKVFRCSLCAFYSFSRDSTEQHIKIHNEPQNTKLYYCSTCKYSTRIKPYFDKHRKLHANTIVRPFKCSYCPYQGRFRSHTRAHEMRHHTGEKPYVCSLCEKGFVEQHILARHMRTAHTDERPYVCDVCSRSYKQLNALRVHQKKHFDDAYICEFCEKRFSTIHQLQRHLESHQDKTESCPVEGCDFKTINDVRLASHMKNFHKTRKCTECDFVSAIHSEFVKHRNSHTKKIRRTFKCEHCSKTFVNINNLKRHMATHTGERDFKCDKCSYNTQKKSYLIKHLELHRLIELKPELMEKFMKCDQCDFICETSKNMGMHRRIHNTIHTQKETENDITYTCSLCKESLSSREKLVDHLLFEHSNYKTFKCHHCPYQTNTQSEMNMHLDFHEIHSNESADVHICGYCGYMHVDHEIFGDHAKECATKANKGIKKPGKYEMEDSRKPYKCPLCPSRVTSPSSLKLHILSHSGVHPERKHLKCNKQRRPDNMDFSKILEDDDPKVLLCDLCDFFTTNAGALTSHQKVHKMHDRSFVENRKSNRIRNQRRDLADAEDEISDEGYDDSAVDMEGLEESEELTDVDDMRDTIEMGPDDLDTVETNTMSISDAINDHIDH